MKLRVKQNLVTKGETILFWGYLDNISCPVIQVIRILLVQHCLYPFSSLFVMILFINVNSEERGIGRINVCVTLLL